jgi:hypothetical protein
LFGATVLGCLVEGLGMIGGDRTAAAYRVLQYSITRSVRRHSGALHRWGRSFDRHQSVRHSKHLDRQLKGGPWGTIPFITAIRVARLARRIPDIAMWLPSQTAMVPKKHSRAVLRTFKKPFDGGIGMQSSFSQRCHETISTYRSDCETSGMLPTKVSMSRSSSEVLTKS